MVDLHHKTITTPIVTPEDRILHGLTKLTDTLTDAPTAQLDVQLQAITSLHEASVSWTYPDENPEQPPLPDTYQTRKYIRVKKEY